VIEIGFSEGEKRDIPILAVLVSISQGTEVTTVTEYDLFIITLSGIHSYSPIA